MCIRDSLKIVERIEQVDVDVTSQATKFATSEETQTLPVLTFEPAEFTLFTESKSDQILDTSPVVEIYDFLQPDKSVQSITVGESATSIFGESIGNVTLIGSESDTNLFVEQQPIDPVIDAQELIVTLQSSDQSFALNIQSNAVVGDTNTTSADIRLQVPSSDTVAIPVGFTVSEIINIVEEQEVSDTTLVNIGSTLSVAEQISVTYQSDGSGFVFTSDSDITPIVEPELGKLPLSTSSVEVSTVLDTIDKRDASDELTSEVQIDSIVNNAAIDEFNEQINPSEIDLNP